MIFEMIVNYNEITAPEFFLMIFLLILMIKKYEMLLESIPASSKYIQIKFQTDFDAVMLKKIIFVTTSKGKKIVVTVGSGKLGLFQIGSG